MSCNPRFYNKWQMFGIKDYTHTNWKRGNFEHEFQYPLSLFIVGEISITR